MEKLILKTLILSTCLLLAACGKKEDELSSIDSYTLVSGTLTQNDANGIGGAGDAVLRFASTFPGITSNKTIEIKGSLQPAGSVAVIFNSDDLALSDSKGVIFRLNRSTGPFDTSCTGSVSINGVSAQIANARLTYINCLNFDVFVEVHNTPTSVRLLVWRKDLGSYSIVNADVDSATPAHFVNSFPSGGGQGIFTGLKLHDVTISGAQVSDAKVTLP